MFLLKDVLGFTYIDIFSIEHHTFQQMSRLFPIIPLVKLVNLFVLHGKEGRALSRFFGPLLKQKIES